MFGYTWVSQYGAAPDGAGADTWATALGGLTWSQINTGLSAALTSGAEWPPSAPRFKAMCHGIPSLESVHYAIRTKAEPTPFLRQVRLFLDTYRLASADHQHRDKIIAAAYRMACTHVMEGRDLPEAPPPAKRIDVPEHRPFQGGKEAFADLAKKVGIRLEDSEGGTDA